MVYGLSRSVAKRPTSGCGEVPQAIAVICIRASCSRGKRVLVGRTGCSPRAAMLFSTLTPVHPHSTLARLSAPLPDTLLDLVILCPAITTMVRRTIWVFLQTCKAKVCWPRHLISVKGTLSNLDEAYESWYGWLDRGVVSSAPQGSMAFLRSAYPAEVHELRAHDEISAN